MKIRSITYFDNPVWPLDMTVIRQAAEFAAIARPTFENVGYEVQTIRLATPPYTQILADSAVDKVVEFAQALEAALIPLGFEYISIGPALPENPKSYAVIPSLIAATENVFASGVMASRSGGVSLSAVRSCAEVIHRLASQDNGAPVFALATEAADLAVAAFTQAHSLKEARRALITSLETHAQKLAAVADSLVHRFESLQLQFGGIDYSLAPFPEAELSLGTALERLGVPAVGLHGSLAAAAFITNTIDQANFPRVGFSGLMLPVLEDATLAARAAQRTLTIKDLLLYSAVCGTGLDTVPLPGDTTVEQLSAVLLDLATLALRLDKPLTARLMPIPGKVAGDSTGFDFAYFANSRVLGLDAQPLAGLLVGDESFSVEPQKRK